MSFSGSYICLSDEGNGAIIYSLEDSKKNYELTPQFQFFMTDYKEFRRDERTMDLIDMETGRKANELDRTPIFDIDANSYPQKYQPGIDYGKNGKGKKGREK